MIDYDFPAQREPLPVILDCDTSTGILGAEIDDGFAILLCLALEKLERLRLLGITGVAGNTNVHQGVVCTLKILEMMGRQDIPVYKGADKPLILDRKPSFNPEHIDEPMGGKPTIRAQTEHAVDFIIRTVKALPH